MTIYAKKVQTIDRCFSGRRVLLESFSTTAHLLARQHPIEIDTISVPDLIVLCNGCNKNICPEPGYLVYLGERELTDNHPYSIYCEACLKVYFSKYQEVIDE